MNDELDHSWSDERIIEHIRHWAVERSKFGLDGRGANRINEKQVLPAAEILKHRGAPSLMKLVPLALMIREGPNAVPDPRTLWATKGT
ncbi:MAG: hypothetical protein JO258_19405 [Alphaproteobacteria bacterium]|nr:hypothetical protein [Alphaproteobacteria bacterium]